MPPLMSPAMIPVPSRKSNGIEDCLRPNRDFLLFGRLTCEYVVDMFSRTKEA
jgi:hypothetical protein